MNPVRLAYAAAHVVVKPDYAAAKVSRREELSDWIDWDRTIAYRRYLWGLGLGVAEAMDTAQRSSLGWHVAAELIDRTLEAAVEAKDELPWTETVCGAGADGLDREPSSISELVDEYVRQGKFIQERGGTAMLLASPFMPKLFPEEKHYVELYGEVCNQLEAPLFIHWLGPMFDARLKGYFPGESFYTMMHANADKVRGVKLSMLDEPMEIAMRQRLNGNGQIVLTGDDYNYPRLILGDGSAGGAPFIEINGRKFPTGDFSHALLGIFDAIAPVAAAALEKLAAGDPAAYEKLMNATEPLARHIFAPPTELYKAGVVFLAYLNGHQEHFKMIDDMQDRRDASHYREIFRMAKECGVLADPSIAQERMRKIFAD